MMFIVVLILSTTLLAASAAFFSIYGLATIFSGSFWPVVIMGSSLEIGKLVAASFLYRYWKIISGVMKAYLATAIIVLMFLTSVGIFGYLSLAHLQDSVGLKQLDAQISLLEKEKDELSKRKTAIDNQISQLPAEYVKGRTKLMNEFAPEVKKINTRLPEITNEIQILTKKQLETQVHVGPITYIAAAFGSDIDQATKWMILLIVFAFDPLAVVLTIGTNIAIKEHTERKSLPQDDNERSVPPLETADTAIDVPPVIVERFVEMPVEVPVDRIVETIVEMPVEVPVIVERFVEIPITKHVVVLCNDDDRVNKDAEEWIQCNENSKVLSNLHIMAQQSRNESPSWFGDRVQMEEKINLLRDALTDMKSRTSLSLDDQNQIRVIEHLLKKRNVL